LQPAFIEVSTVGILPESFRKAVDSRRVFPSRPAVRLLSVSIIYLRFYIYLPTDTTFRRLRFPSG
jgi:hypothetical protein